ncbi:hypothetical protein JCM19239_2662 [Vibrio variabilis]|uniref:Uncharacterized protein n=1 Tax=Vibrio variabilis TaxID=990271 RepID=A0ABQ0JSS2_9VIBR|nr:hypothetical protein JCM19239_2662 [Vibrio variabilis]
MIPDISHEQCAATFAKWMGLDSNQIDELFPVGSENFDLDLRFLTN